jgi:hypothetical protein
MRSYNRSNGTPLDPLLFWLDNTFKEMEQFSRTHEHLEGFNGHEPKITVPRTSRSNMGLISL